MLGGTSLIKASQDAQWNRLTRFQPVSPMEKTCSGSTRANAFACSGVCWLSGSDSWGASWGSAPGSARVFPYVPRGSEDSAPASPPVAAWRPSLRSLPILGPPPPGCASEPSLAPALRPRPAATTTLAAGAISRSWPACTEVSALSHAPRGHPQRPQLLRLQGAEGPLHRARLLYAATPCSELIQGLVE